MNEDTTQGWYHFEGTVYISQSIANDPMRTASVINHEGTHQLLSATTPHGFVQETLELCRDQAWEDSNAPNVEVLRSMMIMTSGFVHEATATYCELMDLAGQELERELTSLPASYREGYEIYDSLFSRHQLAPLTRYRIARAIGARAMQTPVLNDWFAAELWRPDNLRSYLQDTSNCPNDRFVKLVEILAALDSDALTKSCGQFSRSADNFMLVPEYPTVPMDMTFSPLPPLAHAQTQARRIAETLSLERSLDEDLFSVIGHPGRMDIAIQPEPFEVIRLSPDETEWSRSADLVTIDRNMFDRPLQVRTSERHGEMAPDSATLLFCKPGYTVPREYEVEIAEIGQLLDRVDPARRMTVSLVGQLALLPHYVKGSDFGGGILGSLNSLSGGRSTLLYTGGTVFGLHTACAILAQPGDSLLVHGVQAGATWALILIRRSRRIFPMLVHPMLISEWERVGEMFLRQYDIEGATSPAVFFDHDSENCIAVFKFLRQYCGWVVSAAEWAQAAADLARAEMGAEHLAGDVALRTDSSYPEGR